MKVVVIGASGNAGTGVLRALRDADDVTEVVAVARRVPRRTPPEPYDVASWVRADVADPAPGRALATLTQAMQGADAVIHLAWAIQPNHDRALLRRTNVDGTARVLEAARGAGVGHVVVASSVGAYSPAHDDERHNETWPTHGIPASEYSVDKADVEALLDAHERDHPEVTVTRLRPALIFQRHAGAQMLRYFLGRWMPGVAFTGALPVLPWPEGLRLQAVHADDVGRAYLQAVRHRAAGAFNVAGPGVVDAREAADILAGGRYREVPVPLVRATVSAGWNAHALPVSPGWIDMGIAVPLMSTAKARDQWGWEPRHTAADAVRSVVAGIAHGAGTASPPLRPRRPRDRFS
ncbi:NAD-dependent epimerase/dehydratase family protein [Demequina sp. NBRC 110055]|uniref:NAD-dependent epimerase/dehydratase family protein n=1 Tax=Demequina sp. NBRC 110055 TaxID=1570344 RepID=UPI000A070034|nr:NAD-dependent epimerase/dehydratase family protein [Demequina sp. NBRC 110055]